MSKLCLACGVVLLALLMTGCSSGESDGGEKDAAPATAPAEAD